MHDGRRWTQQDQRLLNEGIDRELSARLKAEGRTVEHLSFEERTARRYAIYLDFTTGPSAGMARAKQANMQRMLEVGLVPHLAQTVPFATPDLGSAA